ncbi:ribonuclease D [Marinimicrobium sp. C6131]|uniref:ribonuclease D n=1 Tax=Marinimicrobium sp. C6131 TaxID=3022676 RepID=UPI00223DD3AB|nr:ribonuclease D [Marinimicrobium sp. C6131]UZJ44894.1 ribonuclease D [Marinimicrobium sp. C6131]
MTTIPTEPIWIDQNAELAELCERWREQGAIAVDTEFMRSETFYPIAGLLQIGDGRGCYLIDPLAIDNLEPLRVLFLDPRVTKVLHACSEDLEVFQRWLGVVPEPLFDTQIGAAFAGLGFSLGYANLVQQLLGIEVPKGETRSDWLQRPLSVPQKKYAALDVAHMLVIYGKLLQRLRDQDRLTWARADSADLVANAKASPDFNDYYRKVGSAWKLRPRELAVLRRLSAWREREARKRDRPRNRLIKENGLWELARRQPTDLAQLRTLKEVPAHTQKEEGEALMAEIRLALEEPESEWPERLDPPLGKAEAPLMKALKRYVRELAEAHELPPELLVRKREYEAVVRSGLKGGAFELPERLQGWRYELLGQGLLEAAEAHRADVTPQKEPS